MAEKEKNFIMKTPDGEKIFIYAWEDVENPKGIVQIFHGMAEHAKRYENFAKALNEKGYMVFGDDHRGHGKTIVTDDDYGYLDSNGFNKIVKDEYQLLKTIKKKYSDLPVYIFGHSFGSFIAQAFIQCHSEHIEGVVLSGSACNDGIDIKAGAVIANIEMKIKGERHRSKVLDRLSFGTANKKIDDPVSNQAWLSRDEEVVKCYDDDEYCGGLFTSSFYYTFSKGMIGLYNKEKLNKIRKDLPIFIVAGEMDPIGNYGKKVERLNKLYKDRGINNVHMKLYEGSRHEILNELNKEEVYADVIKWLEESK